MAKILTAAIILAAILAPSTALASGTDVGSTDLIDNASQYDGQEIIYSGEVVGDIMDRGEYSWINVSDGSNAVGAWISNSDMQGVDIAGRYEAHGDTVRITGVFNRACAEHGGDFDIHAESVEVIEKGHAVDHKFSPLKAALSVSLFLAAAILLVFVFRLCIRK